MERWNASSVNTKYSTKNTENLRRRKPRKKKEEMSPPLTEIKSASLIGTANTSFGKREKELIAGKVSTSLTKKKKTKDMTPFRKKIEHPAGKKNTTPAE